MFILKLFVVLNSCYCFDIAGQMLQWLETGFAFDKS